MSPSTSALTTPPRVITNKIYGPPEPPHKCFTQMEKLIENWKYLGIERQDAILLSTLWLLKVLKPNKLHFEALLVCGTKLGDHNIASRIHTINGRNNHNTQNHSYKQNIFPPIIWKIFFGRLTTLGSGLHLLIQLFRSAQPTVYRLI